MARTDAHRPAAIDPQDYDFVACDYLGQYGSLMFLQEREVFRAHLTATGGKFSQHAHGGTCHICGAGAMYVAKFHHRPTNTYIVTGMDCAAKMDMGDARVFRDFRSKVRAGLEAAAGKRKAQATLAAAGLSQAWEIYTATNADGHRWEENTIGDIVGKLVKYGSISDKQQAFIGNLLTKIEGRTAIDAQRAIAKAASQHVGVEGERRDFTLTVKAVPSFDSAFGTVYVHICRDEAGNTVIYKGKEIAEKGQTVTLKATIKQHGERDGEKQTIIARPANVKVVASQEEAA